MTRTTGDTDASVSDGSHGPQALTSFSGKVELFEREKGWYYVAVPLALSGPLLAFADRGLVAITAHINDSAWPTSLLPMGDGRHFIALPAKVRNKEHLTLGDIVTVRFYPRKR
ncbi:MAG: DUF1905 domain-containing protein [Coriobacteriales bacterium]|jgi:hypothetical protein|nr:DUF1905 domain-containing protein [Coriobacteriales bacterium]